MLFLRLAVFPLFIAAVVHVIRNRISGDQRRMGGAAIAAFCVGFSSVISILVENEMPTEIKGMALVALKLTAVIPLAGVMWVSIYCGVLVGDAQGDYWVKRGTKWRNAAAFCLAVILALFAYNWAILRFSAVAVAAPPAGRIALSAIFTNLTYSMGEEFFYRGCVQALLVFWFARVKGNNWWAVILTSIVFMAQHVDPFQQEMRNLLIFPAGLAFGIIFWRFGIWAAVTTHFLASVLMVFVLPLFF